MPIHRLVIMALVVCVSVAGCARSPRVDTLAEADVIRDLDRRWQAAIEAKDVATAASFFAPEGVQMPANAPTVVGREAIHQWFDEWLPDPNISNIFMPEVIEVAASGDLAYDRGTYRFVMDSPEGRIEDVGKYLLIWKKIDGEWKAIADISNSDMPLPGQ